MTRGAPLLVEPMNGLANRIRALDGAVALARAQSRDVVVDWTLDDPLAVPLDVLVEAPAELVTVRSWRPSHHIDRARRRLRHAAWRARGGVRIGRERIMRWLEGDGSPQRDLPASRPFLVKTWTRFCVGDEGFGWLRASSAVRDRLDALSAGLDLGSRVGIHIRRGDHAWAIARTPLSAFFDAMARCVDGDAATRFLVATDDASVEAEALRRFGDDRVGTLPKRGRDRISRAAVEDAFVDLLALARCAAVLGTLGSTFCMTAAELGGVPFEVVGTGARWRPGDGPMQDAPPSAWSAPDGRTDALFGGVRVRQSTSRM